MSMCITFTGTNAAAVRAWVNEEAPPHTTHFVTKGMSAPTGMQAWRFVAAGRSWPNAVRAAVYDPHSDEWMPMRRGDTIVRAHGRVSVLRPVDS